MQTISLFIHSKKKLYNQIESERFQEIPLKCFLSETRKLEAVINASKKNRATNHFYKIELITSLKNKILSRERSNNDLNAFFDITYHINDQENMSVLKTFGITSCMTLDQFKDHVKTTTPQRYQISKHLLEMNI